MVSDRREGLDLDAVLALLFPGGVDDAVRECAVAAAGPHPVDLRALRRILAAVDRLDTLSPVQVRFGPDDVVALRTRDLTLMLDAADVAVSRQLIEQRGVYEPHLSPVFEHFCRPGATVVDVGANIGFYTLLAARRVGPSGRVVAVEPNSENCRLLLLATALNGLDNVELLPVALDGRRGWSYFSTHLGSNGGFLRGGPALADGAGTIVPTFPLDELLDERIDLLKLDVEGAEARVLAGARRIITGSRPVVLTELSPAMLARTSESSPEAYLGWFVDHDYRLYLADRRRFRLEPQADPHQLLDGWDDPERIEDLVLLPAELT